MSGDGDDVVLALRYRHGRGGFGAYFEALGRGRALASRDATTGRVSFPPVAGARPESHVHLSGLGTVRAVTRGPAVLPLGTQPVDACFALVAMDGADNLSFGRVEDPAGAVAPGDRVRLVALGARVPHPSQAACFVPHDEGEER